MRWWHGDRWGISRILFAVGQPGRGPQQVLRPFLSIRLRRRDHVPGRTCVAPSPGAHAARGVFCSSPWCGRRVMGCSACRAGVACRCDSFERWPAAAEVPVRGWLSVVAWPRQSWPSTRPTTTKERPHRSRRLRPPHRRPFPRSGSSAGPSSAASSRNTNGLRRPWSKTVAAFWHPTGRVPLRAPWTGMRGSARAGGC